ncbi:uncharacterized protein [Apostichopus japonicus]|uniref:uncharacterized protein isoform X2 n=1 Tax=Stichopus japonicus TaxID=307972 RepID=UPI003AB845B9
MNNVFQVSQSTFGVTEDSSFKRRWTYRPKSQPSKGLRRVATDNRVDDDWECLTGWDLEEQNQFGVCGTLDITGWIKKAHNTKEDGADQFLYSMFMTCPSIFNYEEFKTASLNRTNLSSDKVRGDSSVKEGIDEAVQVDIRPKSVQGNDNKGKDSVEVESVQSASTVSCEDVKAPEQEADKDIREVHQILSVKEKEINQARESRQNLEGEQGSSASSIDCNRSRPSNTRSCLKSKSASSIRQKYVLQAERPASSAVQSKTEGAGDSAQQSALRKNSLKKVQPKKVTLNPAPIAISYTEEGCFEIGSLSKHHVNSEPCDDDDDKSEDQTNENDQRIISLRTPDRRVWEQSLKQESGFQLPLLSDLSVGDLLTSTPRLQQLVDKKDSRLTYIQSLYNRNATSNVVSLETLPTTESYIEDKKGFSNLPSLRTTGGSPQNLMVSQMNNVSVKDGDLSSTTHPDSSNRHSSHPGTDGLSSMGNNSSKNDRSEHKTAQQVNGIMKRKKVSPQKSRAASAMPATNQQRGPPGFRPHSNKTPLQRAMENAHKRIYGEHHYLLSAQNAHLGKVEASPSAKDTRFRQTKSAHANKLTNTYIWKERLDHNIKHQRTMSAKLVSKLSSSSTNTIDPSVQILSKAELRHTQLQNSYSELFRLARQKKLQLKTVTDKYYTMSDFKAPLETNNALRTQRRRVGQKEN